LLGGFQVGGIVGECPEKIDRDMLGHELAQLGSQRRGTFAHRKVHEATI
jgi:hypothetical protein